MFYQVFKILNGMLSSVCVQFYTTLKPTKPYNVFKVEINSTNLIVQVILSCWNSSTT